MKKLIRPACLLFYPLVFFVFLFASMSIAGLSGAAENQGLAGGAIILGYGFLAGSLALIVAFYIAYNSSIQTIKRANKVLGIILGLFVAWFGYRFFTK